MVKKLLSASKEGELEQQGVDWTTTDAWRGKAAYAPQHSGDHARFQASRREAAENLQSSGILCGEFW
jgi:hypothetical protein